MYSKQDFKNLLFIDIETTSEFQNYEDLKQLRPLSIEHWAKKTLQIKKAGDHLEKDDDEIYQIMSAIYPEFGKIRVISIGQIKFDENSGEAKAHVRSFYGDDEDEILREFLGTMQSVFNKNPNVQLVGHNVKNFDMPYIIKRSIINKLAIPYQFHFQKKKPWENCILDTYDVWKFGGIGSASLDLICESLNIPSPKGIMHAIETTEQYWLGNLEKIKEYCEGDVIATMNVMLRMSNLNIIE
jgi:predicted PolB exonuclease-like 3'-5' exonuclease